MILTFLKASIPLTKSYIKKPNGTVEKRPYPHVYEVTSITEKCQNLKTFESLLKKHAAKGHCLLKSNPTRTLVSESRAGSTDSNAVTDWIVFDVDGLANCATAEDFMKLLHFENISYVVQYSASYKIENNDLRAHIFVQLDKPLSAPLIKQWLISLNHDIPEIHDAMKLTKTGNSISWPLDISACQNDKLLYIAPPILKGLKDPAPGQRIQYIRKVHDTLVIPGTIATTAQNQQRTHKRINELRVANGLTAHKNNYKIYSGVQVLVKPDEAMISDMKTERGFVYFNLNGGDSWGYYHPEDNPDFIHNFKDEPTYLTKELLPDYWRSLTEQAIRTDSKGITYLAFCDRKSGTYWRGTYDESADILDLYQAKTEVQVRHFAKQYGLPLGDFIPEWDIVFDPHDTVRVDIANKTVNIFEPTEYMKAKPKSVKSCPPLVFKIIHHALGEDTAITEHFMNWLAYIAQHRDRAKTAWILHGTQGTGKGIIINKILKPIFGTEQTAMRRMEELNEPYNGFMEKCFIVFVDEMHAKALMNERGAMAKIFNFITEESIIIRAMYKNGYAVQNYTSWIFASNKADPVAIDKEDRRFNVGAYQKNKLQISQQEIDEQIPKELQAFYDWLLNYPVDIKAASTPIESEDRATMMTISESSIDSTAAALLDGNFEHFMDQLPTTKSYQKNALEFNRTEDYIDVLKTLLGRTEKDGKCNISRDELRTLFDYNVGNIPSSPNKFTSLLKHHRIHTTKIRIDDTTPYGLKVVWKDVTQFDKFKKELIPTTKVKTK